MEGWEGDCRFRRRVEERCSQAKAELGTNALLRGIEQWRRRPRTAHDWLSSPRVRAELPSNLVTERTCGKAAQSSTVRYYDVPRH
jgi:hypothetical protein